MKSLIAGLAMLVSAQLMAGTCNVTSIYSELEEGINKQTICHETLVSIYDGAYNISDNYHVEIEAFGDRQMHSVELTSIKFFLNGKLMNSGSGTLVWYPGDEFVLLD